MDHEFRSIVEKLALLEGRLDSKEVKAPAKKEIPALFSNLKKKEESAIPMVGGVEFAEEKTDDVLSKVKASLADYLKNAEDNLKQDRDLIAKKKQDLDLKKKELKDLELQTKKDKVEETDPANALAEEKLQVGDPIIVTAPNEFDGMTGEIVEFSPSGKFVVVRLYNHDEEVSMHLSDVEYNQYADDEDADEYGEYEDDELAEEPNQTPAGGEGVANDSDPTYAQGSNNTYAESAPVKTLQMPINEMGGSVLVEIHGNERDGFNIHRAGKKMATTFKSIEEAEMALEIFAAHRAEKLAQQTDADYLEEK